MYPVCLRWFSDKSIEHYILVNYNAFGCVVNHKQDSRTTFLRYVRCKVSSERYSCFRGRQKAQQELITFAQITVDRLSLRLKLLLSGFFIDSSRTGKPQRESANVLYSWIIHCRVAVIHGGKSRSTSSWPTNSTKSTRFYRRSSWWTSYRKRWKLMKAMFLNTIADCGLMRRTLKDLGDIDAEIACLSEECEIVAERVRSFVKENSSTAQSQVEYLKSMVVWISPVLIWFSNLKGWKRNESCANGRTKRCRCLSGRWRRIQRLLKSKTTPFGRSRRRRGLLWEAGRYGLCFTMELRLRVGVNRRAITAQTRGNGELCNSPKQAWRRRFVLVSTIRKSR